MGTNITIAINSHGRNTIPIIKPNNIIQIQGKNGVGKSMAATLMEIASGNYIFESEGHFQKLKNVIDSCSIEFKVAENEKFLAKLSPSTWQFDRNLNKVLPISLGEFFFNGKDISYEDFNKKINVRTIRGNESLTQQIKFFKEIFLAKINQRIRELESKSQFVENYKGWLKSRANQDDLKQYQDIQKEYSSLIEKQDHLKSSINQRETIIRENEEQLKILKEILFLLENNEGELKEKRLALETAQKQLKEQRSVKVQRQTDLKAKYDQLTIESNAEIQKLSKDREKLLTNRYKLRETIKQIFEPSEFEKIDKLDDLKQSIDFIEGQIQTMEITAQKSKKEFEKLALENERIIDINSFLLRLEEICNQNKDKPFGKELILKLEISGQPTLDFSPEQLGEIINASKLEFKKNAELQEYEHKVQQFNTNIERSKKQKDLLGKLEDIQKKLNVIDKKFAGLGTTIDGYLNKEHQIANITKEQEELQKIIDEFDKNIWSNEEKLKSVSNTLDKLANSPSINRYLNDLKSHNLTLSSRSLAECTTKIQQIEQNLGKEKQTRELQNRDQELTDQNLKDIRRRLEPISQKIRDVAKSFGIKDLGEWINYLAAHESKANKFSGSLKNLLKRLVTFRTDLEEVVEGGQPRNNKNVEIITAEFDKIFKELYDHPDFFTHVFKDYNKIKRFDIGARTIVFETPAGLEEKRDLGEFSSGEKTYAYCRAIISMAAHSAQYPIVILDESYALLDHDHSQDLYRFQKEKIQEGGVSKFINILPLKEDLSKIIAKIQADINKEKKLGDETAVTQLMADLQKYQGYYTEVTERGYYQELIA